MHYRLEDDSINIKALSRAVKIGKGLQSIFQVESKSQGLNLLPQTGHKLY